MIAALKPDLVLQPWTEELTAPTQWKGPGAFKAHADDAFRIALDQMARVAAVTLRQIGHLPVQARREIGFVGENGLGKNLPAVKNLAQMGKMGTPAYLHHGKKIPKIATLLPGVTIEVLGPPTIKQKADVADQKQTNTSEYWHFTRFWNLRAALAELADGTPQFRRTRVHARIPIENRWFVARLKRARGDQLLRIVHAMDDAMNNTSLILLMKAGSKKFLFPGDAQWENWEYALTKNAAQLTDVDVYKVGHHGSLNATPKTLWKTLGKKAKTEGGATSLTSVMSTRTDSMHGHRSNNSEVPRDTLVEALRDYSKLRSTQELEAAGDLVLTLNFTL
jgi:hypothetical protein